MSDGWERNSLGELSDIAYGYTAKASHEVVGPKFLRISDLTEKGVNWNTVPTCPIDDEDFAKHKLQRDDIVFARTGATTGKSYLIQEPPDSIAASYLIRLRLKHPDTYAPFVALFFQTKEYWDAIDKGIAGAAQGGFNATKLKGLSIPLPQKAEQKQIVAILDEAFSAIAKAKAVAEKNLANARELFESYLNRVFTQQGDGWEEKLLPDICENLDRQRKPITKSKRESGEIPYYGASGVVDHVKGYLFDEDLLLVSEDGANLLARTYPIAFSICGRTWVNNHAHVLRFENTTSQRFVEYYINSISITPWVSGMAQPKLNQTKLNLIPVPFAPLDQQADIVKRLECLQDDSKRLVTIYEQKLANLDELKQSLLQKAFTGQLTAESKTADRVLSEAGV